MQKNKQEIRGLFCNTFRLDFFIVDLKLTHCILANPDKFEEIFAGLQ